MTERNIIIIDEIFRLVREVRSLEDMAELARNEEDANNFQNDATSLKEKIKQLHSLLSDKLFITL
jgi:hypothetical protein